MNGRGVITLKTGYLVGTAVVFTYLLMVMGTFVTSTGSGLACPDWPLCYGTVKPPLRLSIWFEWGHRLLGATTGTLVVLSTIFVWWRYRGLPRLLTTVILGLLASAVLLGGLTVLIEAPQLQSMLHVAVISTHLVIATMVFTCLIFTLRSVDTSAAESERGYYGVLFSVVYLQIILGILVRYSGATLACPDFPLCGGGLPALSDHGAVLHFIHRLGAVAVFGTASFLLYKTIRQGRRARGLYFALGLIILQALFGTLIVLTAMFLPFIIMHGATGFLLLGFLAYKSTAGISRRTAPREAFG